MFDQGRLAAPAPHAKDLRRPGIDAQHLNLAARAENAELVDRAPISPHELGVQEPARIPAPHLGQDFAERARVPRLNRSAWLTPESLCVGGRHRAEHRQNHEGCS
jgi:hypothetical protein